MAEPLSLIKKNGKAITVTLLLAVLVLFYLLGIFFKSADHSSTDQTSQEVIDSLISNKPHTALDQESSAAELESGTESSPELKTAKDLSEEKVDAAQAALATSAEPSDKNTSEQPAPNKSEALKPLPATTTQAEQTLPVTVKVSTDPASIPQDSAKEIKYILEAVFDESSQVTVKVDDQPEKQYFSQAGIARVWKAHNHISLALGNPAAVTLTLNGTLVPSRYLPGPNAPLQIPGSLPTNILP